MSGAQQITFMNQRSFGEPVPTVIGQAFGGGFYAGQISTTANSVATHYLVVGPRSTAQAGTTLRWKTSNTITTGTSSVIEGPANTAAMIAAGAAEHPCGQFCDDLVIGGFSDWYMPAQNELEVCYFNLKPSTNANDTSFGINPNAVPARATNYTTSNPAQTSAITFRTGGAEAFTSGTYWSSTELSTTNARGFGIVYGGSQYSLPKNYERNIRATRRVPV
jgi:hypothetical protein